MPTPLSHTRIEAWDSCPYFFKAQYIDKIPQRKTPPLMVGNFFHEWAESYVRHLTKTKQQTDLAFGAERFEKMWEMRHGSKDYKTLPEKYYADLAAMIDGFLKTHVFDPDKVGGVELELAFDVGWKLVEWMAPDVFFRMKVDRIDLDDDVCTVVDYKTGWAVESEEQMPSNAQLKRYVFGASRMIKATRWRVSLDYVRFGYTRTIDIDLAEAEKEQARIEAVSRRIERAIKANEFPATPGTSCNWCPVFDACPAKKDAAEFRGVQTEDEAIAALGMLILSERNRKALQDALKAWTGTSGVVKSGGMQYGPSRRQELTYPLADVQGWLSRHGIIDPMLIKVSTEEMKKVQARLAKAAKSGNEGSRQALDDLPAPEVRVTTAYLLKKEAEEA